MAQPKSVSSLSTTGQWIARDQDAEGNKGWRVKVPTPNGHRFFLDERHGGISKAFQEANNFHTKMHTQLLKDRAAEKNGAKIHRDTTNIRNRSGHTGVSMQVNPTLSGRPTIVYTATWLVGRIQHHKSFSTAKYGTKELALSKALEHRNRMKRRYK